MLTFGPFALKKSSNPSFLSAALVLQIGAAVASAQSTAFTYQGQLKTGGNPVSGSYDLSFMLYDASSSGNRIGPGLTNFTTVDADGVALAAIQGLNQKLSDALKKRDEENAELKARLAKLEKLMQQLVPAAN